jgi:hypothetical protein
MGDFDDDFDNDSIDIEVSVDDAPSTSSPPKHSHHRPSASTLSLSHKSGDGGLLSTTIRPGTISALTTLRERELLLLREAHSSNSNHRNTNTNRASGSRRASLGAPTLQRSASTSSASMQQQHHHRSVRAVRLSSSLAGAAADAMRQKAQREELKKLNESRKNKKAVKAQPASEAIVKLAIPHKRSTDAISASFEVSHLLQLLNSFTHPLTHSLTCVIIMMIMTPANDRISLIVSLSHEYQSLPKRFKCSLGKIAWWPVSRILMLEYVYVSFYSIIDTRTYQYYLLS